MHLERARAIVGRRIANPTVAELEEARRLVAQAGLGRVNRQAQAAAERKRRQAQGTAQAEARANRVKDSYKATIQALGANGDKIYWFYHVLGVVSRKRRLVGGDHEFVKEAIKAGVSNYARVLSEAGILNGEKINFWMLDGVMDEIHKNWGRWGKSIK